MTALHPGLRSEKITILMPKSLVEDLRALRLVTGQSTGDLVNQLLEAHLEGAHADVEAGRAMLQIREKRKGGDAASSGVLAAEAAEASGGQPSPETEEAPAMPDAAFIESWASTERKPGKCIEQANSYVQWCEAGAHPIVGSFELFASEVLAKKYKPETVKTYGRFVKRFIDAWAARAKP